MPSEFRITLAVAQVLREFLLDPAQPRYGYDLMQSTGFSSAKTYQILGRLSHAGWLVRTAEDIDPSEEGRPARHTYVLSKHGAVAARRELAALHMALSLPTGSAPQPHGVRVLRPRTGGGAA